jgi:hypothetical protein
MNRVFWAVAEPVICATVGVGLTGWVLYRAARGFIDSVRRADG